jgi:hypothetical protein
MASTLYLGMGPGWDAVTNNMVVTDSNSLLYSRVFSNFAIITGNSTVIAISCGPSLGGHTWGGRTPACRHPPHMALIPLVRALFDGNYSTITSK